MTRDLQFYRAAKDRRCERTADPSLVLAFGYGRLGMTIEERASLCLGRIFSRRARRLGGESLVRVRSNRLCCFCAC